nr:unnamed protein product [Digitaria exilis]
MAQPCRRWRPAPLLLGLSTAEKERPPAIRWPSTKASSRAAAAANGGVELRATKLPLIGHILHLGLPNLIGVPPHRILRHLSRRYGAGGLLFLKIGEIPTVVVSSREAVEEVMKTHDAIFATRLQTETVKSVHKRGSDIAFAPYGNEWRQLRRICMVELLSTKRPSLSNLLVFSTSFYMNSQVRLTTYIKMQDLLLSGTHTVTTIIDWAMAELMRNPLVMSRAQSEVRTAFMEQMKVTEEGLRKLRYFHWVIKETLRLHSPGPLLIGRGSQETCRVMGYDVPKGSMVLVSAWAMSRDPKYWDEPETFKPERFENDTRDFRDHDFEFTPFGAGRRMCPGVSFGLASVELALANLLFHFDWNLPDGVDANKLDMAETMGFAGKRKAEHWLKPILRVPFASRN